MPKEMDAVIAGLRRDAQRQLAGMPARSRRRRPRLSQADQFRRFLAGTEKRRLESGEVTVQQYRAYQESMLKELERQGALETGGQDATEKQR